MGAVQQAVIVKQEPMQEGSKTDQWFTWPRRGSSEESRSHANLVTLIGADPNHDEGPSARSMFFNSLLEHAANVMITKSVSCLPETLPDGKVLGLVTWKDILKALILLEGSQ